MIKNLLIRTRRGTWKMAPWTKGPDGFHTLQEDPIEIQSLVFSKDAGWTAEKAVAWAKEHDFQSDKVDENDTQVRLRQFDPESCQPDSFKTWPIEGVDGVNAVGCRKKAAEEDAFAFSNMDARTVFGLVRAGDPADNGGNDNVVEGTASMDTVDRYQEVIKPDAYSKWLPVFKQHPVMLLGHESDASLELPIGDWRKKVEITENSLQVVGELMPEHRRYTEVHAAIKRRLLALSVGFIPKAGHEATDDELVKYGAGVRFVWDEVELLEISPVSLPANRESLLALRAAARREAEVTVDAGTFRDLVKDLTALEKRTASVRRKIRDGEVKNWKPLVDEIKKVTNDFANAFSGAVGALEKYLEEQLGPGEPAPDDGEPDGGPDEGTEEDAFEALRNLQHTTGQVAGTN